MKAIWENHILAESDETIEVDGHHYFPPDSINEYFFNPSITLTSSPEKGDARYFNITVNNSINKDAAWYYPRPRKAAHNIRGYVAFWKGVEIIE
ncbi:MAG: DUF427 domain-containing protein [Balneolales bacterium]